MKKLYRTTIILALVFVVLSLATMYLYNAKYVQEYSVKDPDSGQVVLFNSSTNKERPPLQLLGPQNILDKGMTTNQYAALKKDLADTISNTYQKKYKSAAINADSVAHDSETDTFSFKVRVGEIGSDKYLSVTAIVTTEDTLQVTVKDDTGKVLKEGMVNVS